jgi:hypothetical protein
MNDSLSRKINLFGAWSGMIWVAMLFLGWFVIGGFFPLHRPSAGAEEIAEFFRGNVNGIRIGMVIVMWSSAFFLPFTATVADFVSRVEGRNGPLTRTVTMAGFANAMLGFYPPLYWLTAAFRPQERSAEILYLLNDIAWLQFIGGLSLVMPMFIGVGFAALLDQSPTPTFPRWAGFACFLGFVLMLPDQLLFFFHTGPFAWNGLISFWLPIPVFSSVFIMFFFFLRRDALRGA